VPEQDNNPSPVYEIFIPMKLARRSGRKLIIMPGNDAAKVNDPLVKAIVQSYRWQQALDQNKADSIKALAAQEGVDYTYGTKIARLMLLAPDIIEMILTDKAPRGLSLAECLRPFPLDWGLQRVHFGIA
jgi:hypothetical protein